MAYTGPRKGSVGSAVAGAVGALVLLAAVIALIAGSVGGGLTVSGVLIAVVAAAVLGGLLFWASSALDRREGAARRRRAAIAAEFGFELAEHVPLEGAGKPPYDGIVFGLLPSPRAVHLLTHSATRGDVQVANYSAHSGRNSATSWGVLRIPLERALPHMLLDATDGDLLGTERIASRIDRSQRLSLEGDFDRYFTLYCPAGYERDALYLFTPDFMALLIDEAAAYDVEIVDDRMFVYRPGRFDLSNREVWTRLQRIVELVGSRANARAERWTDDRSPEPARVASGGRALRASGPSTLGLIIALGLLAAGVVALVVVGVASSV